LRFQRQYSKEPKDIKNEDIRAFKLRVIDNEGENLGVISKEEALQIARDQGLDLVLISPNDEIPVAKIIDWSKFKYLKSKKSKNKGKSVTIKEWWFNPNIEDRDIEYKLNNVKKFIEKGGKVKITIKPKKRVGLELMYETLNRIIAKSEEFADKASDINREGRNISIFLKNKK